MVSHHQHITLIKRLHLAKTSFILGESKRGEASKYTQGSFRGAKPLQTLSFPLSVEGEGDKGGEVDQ